jgi:hypothetical protein
VGFVVDKVLLGQVFSKYFGFLYKFSFHQMLHTHLSSGPGTVGQLVANIPSGHSLTLPHPKKLKNISSSYSSALKMEGAGFSETLVMIYQTTLCYMPEGSVGIVRLRTKTTEFSFFSLV